LLTELADRARVQSITASSAIEGVIVADADRAQRIISRQATTHSPSSSPKASAIIGRTSTCSAQRRQPGTPVSSPRAKKQPH